jgi:hypothetical protein
MSKGHNITDAEIKAIWAEKNLEKKRSMALEVLAKCVQDSASIRSITNQVQRATSALVIDKKITYLLLVQDGHKVI